MPRKTQFTAEYVVQAAVDLVREKGLAGLSAPAVAEKAGCSTMPIYSHYKNMHTLKDEVVKRAWKGVMAYQARAYTGDIWVDQAIGWVRFARDEENLFNCLFGGHNPALQREMQLAHWEYLAGLLEGYQGFEGMDEELSGRIRYSHAKLTHGLATSPPLGLDKLIMDDDRMLFGYLTAASQALLEGYRAIPPLTREQRHYIEEKLETFSNTKK